MIGCASRDRVSVLAAVRFMIISKALFSDSIDYNELNYAVYKQAVLMEHQMQGLARRCNSKNEISKTSKKQ